MAVNPEFVQEIRERGDAIRDGDTGLNALTSLAEVLAYAATHARRAGRNEVNDVELLVEAIGMSREAILDAESVLRSLGYIAVCDRLRRIARRKRSRDRSRKPVPRLANRLK